MDEDAQFRVRLVRRMAGISEQRAADPLLPVDPDALDRFRALAAGRPPVDPDLAQLPIDDESALRRAALSVLERVDPASEILLVGDDDLVALALRVLGCGRVTVVDLDEDLLAFLGSTDGAIETRRVDLTRDGLADDLAHRFGGVVADPVRSFTGAAGFLEFAGVAVGEGGRLFWCDHPEWNPGYSRVASWLWLEGWRIEEVLENLHAYPPSEAFLGTLRREAPELEPLARRGRAWSHLHVLARSG